MTDNIEKKPCTCPSGDGSLRWPCQEHGAQQGVITELLAELESKAKKAIPDAEWFLVKNLDHPNIDTSAARFIAAATPATLLALIAHIRAQAAELESLRQAAPVAAPDGWREVIENACDSIGAGALQENANTERRYVEPYLDGIYDELEALEKAAAPAAPTPAAPEPIKLSDDVREFLQEWIGSAVEDDDYDFANQLELLLGPIYTATPAAEQPDTVKVPRELLERAAEVVSWMACRSDVSPKDMCRLEQSSSALRALLGKEGEA